MVLVRIYIQNITFNKYKHLTDWKSRTRNKTCFRIFDIEWVWKKKMKSWRNLCGWRLGNGQATWRMVDSKISEMPPLESSQNPQDKTKRKEKQLSHKSLSNWVEFLYFQIQYQCYVYKKPSSFLYRIEDRLWIGKVHEKAFANAAPFHVTSYSRKCDFSYYFPFNLSWIYF